MFDKEKEISLLLVKCIPLLQQIRDNTEHSFTIDFKYYMIFVVFNAKWVV
jgi:hypothetical protein